MDSYFALWLLSLLTMSQLWLQSALVLVWLAGMIWLWINVSKTGVKLVAFLRQIALLLSPVVMLAIISIGYRGRSEWANGSLEILCHPFLPVMELTGRHVFVGISGAYVETCIVPIGIGMIALVSWYAPRIRMNR